MASYSGFSEKQKGGRKMSLEWMHVLIEKNNEKTITKCKYCDCVLSPKIERIRTHLKKCTKFNKNDSNSDTDSNSSHSTSVATSTKVNEIKPLEISTFNTVKNRSDDSLPKKLKRKGTLNDFIIPTTKQQKNQFDEALAEFFYASNLAFEKVEHPSFLRFLNLLRPGYNPPNRKELSGPLLDIVSKKIDLMMTSELMQDDRPITLLQDGWSSVKNDPIIATSIHTGKHSYLLNIIDCKTEKKTAEYCLEVAVDSIKTCEEKLGKKVFAICTDNEHKMVKIRKSLHEIYPNIITYGCSAHYLNLLEKELTPKTVLKHIVDIEKFFRNYPARGLLKKKINSKMLQLPNDTRWNSQIECVDTFINNYHIYRDIVIENESLFESQADYKQIKNKISNINIYSNSLDLQKQLKIIGNALNKLQSDQVNFSEAFIIWKNLLNDKQLQQYSNKIKIRYNQAVTPYHFLANYMDPKYFGKDLSNNEEKEAEELILKYYPEYVDDILSFKIKDIDKYPSNMFSDQVISTMSSHKWWIILANKCDKIDNSNGPKKEFCIFMANLFSCPVSSAATERIFSTYAHVWSKLRNSLAPQKIDKLVKIYRYQNK